MDGGVDHDKIHKNMERAPTRPGAAAQREALRKAIAFKKYEFDAHGAEKQRYVSRGAHRWPQPAFDKDHELHYAPTWPGARLPHVWVYERRRKVSTLDLCGHGEFTLLTELAARRGSCRREVARAAC
jgi:2,4-dichlorophenol 6-monooxygenase